VRSRGTDSGRVSQRDSDAIPVPVPAAGAAPPVVPRWSDAEHPVWRWLLWGCALATAAPLWCARYLPFTDLPQHAAAISSLRRWFDPAYGVQEHFELALGQTQYLLYYLAGAALAWPLGDPERANLVLLSATAVGFPFSLRALLRSLRADERLAVFACPLFWSQALLIGFFNWMAALPVLLWALALAVEQARAPSLRRAALLALLALCLFYLHLSAFLFFVPASAMAFWTIHAPDQSGRWRRLRALPGRVLWAAPVALAGLLFLLRSPVVHPRSVGWRQDMTPQFEDPGTLLRHLPDALLDVWQGSADEWVLLGLLAAWAALAWPAARPGSQPSSEPGSEPSLELERSRLRGLAAGWVALAALLYFAFPVSIGWMWQLNERYALLALLLAPALLRPRPGRAAALPLLCGAALALASAWTAGANVRAFSAEVGPFDEVLAHAAPNRHLLALVFDQGSSVAKFAPFLQFAGYYRARKGGVASFSFAELPQSPLRYRPGRGPPQKPPHWEWEPQSYRNATDGPYYDYVLVHGRADAGRLLAAPGPRWWLSAAAGRWSLYERAEPREGQ
jgi:hypothetical protein